ncbi:hypothetical protein OROGR_010955 [Orobanche gracilis]
MMEESPKNTSTQKNIGRRFSDEQIKSLESIFKVETKLEPKKKLQLARDLGLQPRQIAIWFQNKRARRKSKQIEQEYKDLRAKYDCLYMKVEDLKREKQSLLMQLQELNDLVKSLDVKLNEEEDDDDDKYKQYPDSPHEGLDHDDAMQTYDDNIVTNDNERTEEQELVNWSEEEEIISHFASPGRWCSLSSRGLFDQSSGTSNRWED